MNEILDEEYFEWLYSQVASAKLKNPARTYRSLLGQLYVKEFVWIIPNDDNRLEDGRDLRHEFIIEQGLEHVSEQWLDMGCSMLEMLIGLSRRLSFEAEGEARDWFWHLMDNLGFMHLNDRDWSEEHEGFVGEILDTVIWRTYMPDGHGGLFPLRHPEEDQRDVELWYQLSAYILELN